MIYDASIRYRLLKDRLFKISLGVLSCILLMPLLFILYYIFINGITAFSFDFFLELPKPVGEAGGGISNAIVGTLLLIAVASTISIPFGVLIGLYLSENKTGKLPDITRLCIDTLQGIPSIVMGIIAYTWIVIPLGSFSLFSGAFALSLMMIPLISKSTEETLNLIPDALKEAAYALGAPYHTTLLRVIIPSGKSGLCSGILLGVARVSGETAPLLFTAFGNPFMSVDLFKSVNSLPLLIFNYATSPYQDWQNLAWGASLLLVLFVLSLSLIAKVVSKR
ncbi:phosphate ABC transporter permease PtsA [Candidatus Marinamargulisbacteria bacterium SCGC AAA071-K20]|nr:phosphate ABC transporter permease PtsA [Candidatus Marinamargulisbacteria bacterium SCGC AAA071-K20]